MCYVKRDADDDADGDDDDDDLPERGATFINLSPVDVNMYIYTLTELSAIRRESSFTNRIADFSNAN